MRVARHYLISGRVQGVGFRLFTEAAAGREGVHGWVRNRPDGDVEIHAEGEVEAMERFEARIRSGPPRAVVEGVGVTDLLPGGATGGFSAR